MGGTFPALAAQSGGLRHRERRHARDRPAADDRGGRSQLRRARERCPRDDTDTSYVVVDTFSRASGRHSMKFGGEYRHFINENFAEGTGVFNFPSVEAFLAGTANAFNITLGERRSVIDQRAMGLFVQDQIAVRDRLTLELGTALRVARHAHRAGQPVRRLRRGERVAAARRRRRRRDLSAEQPELRAARRRGVESLA